MPLLVLYSFHPAAGCFVSSTVLSSVQVQRVGNWTLEIFWSMPFWLSSFWKQVFSMSQRHKMERKRVLTTWKHWWAKRIQFGGRGCTHRWIVKFRWWMQTGIQQTSWKMLKVPSYKHMEWHRMCYQHEFSWECCRIAEARGNCQTHWTAQTH